MNLLFPLSVTAASVAVALLIDTARTQAAVATASVGTALVATMLALAVLEHWLLVLPLDTTALWRWALKAGRREPSSLQDHEDLVRAP